MLSRFRRKFHQPPLSVPTFYRYCDCLSILNNPCQIPFCFPPSPYHSHPRFTYHSPNFRSGNRCTGKRSKTQTLGISSVWFGRQKAAPKRSVITIQCCSDKASSSSAFIDLDWAFEGDLAVIPFSSPLVVTQ